LILFVPFGSGIYTWTGLISTVLAALTAGYFLGGFIADRTVSAAVLGMIVGVAYADTASSRTCIGHSRFARNRKVIGRQR